MWLPDLDAYPGPRYGALLQALADDVARGRLRPGERLPPQRTLADLLGLHLSTVTRAYREAARRQLISGEAGRGSFVREPDRADRLFTLNMRDLPQLDLSASTPPMPPDDHDLEQALATLAAQTPLSDRLAYRPFADWAPHRAAMAQWIAQHGPTVAPEQLLLCAGAQHAMAQVLRCLTRPGDTVLCESLTYPGLKALATELQLGLQAIPMDAAGLDPDGLAQRLRRRRARLAVLMPTLHNPTGRTLDRERRDAVIALARQHGLPLVEEDVYGPLLPDAPPTLAALAPEQVIYVSGLSKTIAPGLRIGLIADAGGQLGAAADHWHGSSWYVNPLLADVARLWLADGTASRRLLWQRAELAQRHALLDTVLGPLIDPSLACAPHRWLRCRDRQASASLLRHLARHGITVVGEAVFAVGRTASEAGLRLALGAAPDRDAVTRLADVLKTGC